MTICNKHRATLIAIALSCSVCNQAAAQVAPSINPGSIQSQERDIQEQRERERRLQTTPVSPQITTPRAATGVAANEEKNIPVERFELDPSTVLTPDEIDKVLAPLRGTRASLADLQRAVDAINALYEARGESAARAFLPPQTITGGTVRIRLVESRIGQVRLSGNRNIANDYVIERLRLPTDSRMSVPMLEADLVRFNRLNEAQLRANVVAGDKFGTTDVEISVVEPPPFKAALFTDNAGRETVGAIRGGLTARVQNLLGRSDTTQFASVFSEGSRNFSLSHSVPITPDDLRLDLSYSDGNIRIVDGPFQALDITGQSNDFTVGLSKPLSVSLERMWSAYGRMSWRKSVSEFSGFQQQNQDLRVVSFGVSGERRTDATSWFIDQVIGVGITHWGGEEDFLYYRANANRIDRLSDRVQLVLRGGLQLSDTRQLPSSEQFQIGGMYSVRGFSEGLLSGRSGYFGSAELRFGGGAMSYMERGADSPNLQGFVFVDHGGAFPTRAGNQADVDRNDFLTGAGVGILFEWKKLSGRVAVAHPINRNAGEQHDYSPRIHAFINLSLY